MAVLYASFLYLPEILDLEKEYTMSKESRQKSRKYTPEYKLELVMETYRGNKSISAVASENDISPSVLAEWKKEFKRKAPSIFYYKKVARKSNKENHHIIMLTKLYCVSADYILGIDEHELDNGEEDV
jgi:hypothetical protein